MADQLYLSLWFPNFRLASLPDTLVGVLRQFALIARDGKPDSPFGRVSAASAIPIDWTESPVYQRIYVNDERAADSADTRGSTIEAAVAEATEQMYEDTAYEFEMQWPLWRAEPEEISQQDSTESVEEEGSAEPEPRRSWRLEPRRVRVLGFGPDFDKGSYEENGHVRVDFGLDTPWTLENESGTDENLNKEAAEHIRQNVEKLLAFTLSVEKNCGISSRLLWTESGEPLAEKLVARLQRLN